MDFVSVQRPLSAYTAELTRNGMVVAELSEHGEGPVPWLLILRTEKVGS